MRLLLGSLLLLCPLLALAGPADEVPPPIVDEVWWPGPDPFLFAVGFGRPKQVPFARDLDLDGRAELVMFSRNGEGHVWTCRNELGQKAHGGRRVASGVGPGGRPVAVADLDGNRRPVLCGVDAEGRLTAARLQPDGSFGAAEPLLSLPADLSPKAMRAGDVTGDGLEDLVLLEGGPGPGAAWVLESTGMKAPHLRKLTGQVPARALLADHELVWIDGELLLGLDCTQPSAQPRVRARGVEGPLLATGDVDGDGRDDFVVPGALLLPAQDRLRRVRDPRLKGLPGKQGRVVVGDVDGDGRGDVLQFTLGGAHAVKVSLMRPPAFHSGATNMQDTDGDGLLDAEELALRSDPWSRDTDRDGLLDGWEVHGFRGVALEGANPLRRDIFLELDVDQGANLKRVRKAIRRMEALFSKAPIENPDGSQGITIHCVVDTRTPSYPKKRPNRHQLREMFFTPQRAGLFHWMHLSARGGGGQANLLSDHGSCAGAYEATLPHEFGHQLGLRHGGDRSLNGIPTYPSLMNYAYNYQLGGKGGAIDYSRGTLAHLTLDENALPERVEVGAEPLAYLKGPPFHFRLESRGEEATWIDWNRDGVEDTAPVRANVNATKGEGYGPRRILDKQWRVEGTETASTKAPLLLTVGATSDEPGRLALLWVARASDRLSLRVLDADGLQELGPPRELNDVTGLDHLTALADGEDVHLFAERGPEVVELRGGLDEPQWEGIGIIDSGDFGGPAACLHVAPDGRRTHVLATRQRETGVVRVQRRSPGQDEFDAGRVLELRSQTPVGLAHDTVRDELLLAFTHTQGKRKFRIRLARLDPSSLQVKSEEWVGGPKGRDAGSRRPAILFETAPWLPAAGRVDMFHAGIVDGAKPNTHMYRSYTIGDLAWRGRKGWKEDQTWNEWSYSQDAPAAAWYRGRPFQVTRFYTHYSGGKRWNDHLAVGPRADGICDRGLRDFDDWKVIERRGLERSILQVHTPRGRR